MEDQPKDPIDLSKILLPKKEGPSFDSAQRINAGVLLTQEQQAAAEPAEQAQPIQPALASKREETIVRPLQTYSGDVAGVIEQGGVSAVSIAAAEMSRGREEAQAAPAPDPQKKIRFIYYGAGGLLLIAALGVVGFLFMRATPQVRNQTEFSTPFMTVDQTTVVQVPANITRLDLMQKLQEERQSVSLSVGLVAQLYVGVPTTTASVPELLPAAQLLSILSPDIPGDLARTIEPVYLLGVHSFDENQTFIILRVDSYQQAYAGMLAWETYMAQQLQPLFSRTPSPHLPAVTASSAPIASSTTASSTVASSTEVAASSTPPVQAPTLPLFNRFVDRIVENHDTRVLLNDNGDIVLLWTFLDRSTLVITTNENTLHEVIRRITTASLVPQP